MGMRGTYGVGGQKQLAGAGEWGDSHLQVGNLPWHLWEWMYSLRGDAVEGLCSVLLVCGGCVGVSRCLGLDLGYTAAALPWVAPGLSLFFCFFRAQAACPLPKLGVQGMSPGSVGRFPLEGFALRPEKKALWVKCRGEFLRCVLIIIQLLWEYPFVYLLVEFLPPSNLLVHPSPQV